LVGGKFITGRPVVLLALATDPDQGVLAKSQYTWKVEYVTSIASGSPAVRPFVPEVSGARSAAFTPSTVGPYTLADVAYRVTLTVRDAGGLETTTRLTVRPNVTAVTLRTNVPGLALTLDGQPVTSPTAFQGVAGFRRDVAAAETQTLGGTT